MSLNPRVCKKSYKVHIPMMGEACEFWLITVTDEQSITNPDKDHAYLTDDGKLFVFNGDSLVRVNCDICFTQEEREKLEGIEENANNYTLPEADSNHLGGVVLGYTQNGKNYPVVKDSDGRIYVQVPWVDYSLPKAEDDQLGGIKTGYEQNGKYYPVKVDTNGNAYVNVPWSDTNTVYEVVSNTSDGLAPMLPSENPDKKYLNGDGEWVENDAKSIEINGVNVTGSFYSGETSDCGVEITKVVGKTEQQTTNGYQLFDSSKLATKSQGGATVTNNNDGSFTISGSGSLTENFNSMFVDLKKDEVKKLLKAGKLYGKVEKTTNPFAGFLIFANGNWTELNMKTSDSESITLTEEMLSANDLYARIRFYGGQYETIKTGAIKPIFYQDGDGTWEQYTGGQPAPNPDYPMDIQNSEIKNIHSGTYQLFDASKIPTTSTGGATVTNNGDGSFTISGSGNTTEIIGVNYYTGNVELIKAGNVYIKNNGESSANIQVIGTKVKNNVNSVNRIFEIRATNSPFLITEEMLEETVDICFRIYQSQNSQIVSGTIKPMVYQDGDGTWEPFKHATVETSLKLAEGDVYENGVETKAKGHATFDGSSDESWSINAGNVNGYFRTFIDIPDCSKIDSDSMLKIKCNRFATEPSIGYWTNPTKNAIVNAGSSVNGRIAICFDGVSTVDEWKSWLQSHPLEIEYPLLTPTTEEFKVPTIPSYEPYTEISTNSVVDPTITFRPLPFTTCLVGEATEEESGYMPPLSGNSNEFLNGNGEWTTPSGYTLPIASSSTLGGVKIGENITISSGTISIDKEDVTGALGYTPPTTNTTYSVATTSKDGLMSSTDKAKVDNLRRIYKGTSDSAPSGWVDGDIYVQYEE